MVLQLDSPSCRIVGIRNVRVSQLLQAVWKDATVNSVALVDGVTADVRKLLVLVPAVLSEELL